MSTASTSAAIDSNDLIIGYVPEVTWGVTPATPAFQSLRLDSEGFSGSKTRTRPNEIDPSGQASAAITTKEEATGSLNFSVSAGVSGGETGANHHLLIAASLCGVWTAPLAISNATCAISVASIPNRTCTVTDSGSGLAGIAVGQFCKVYFTGTSTATASFIGRAVTVAAGSVAFDCVSNILIAPATAGAQAGTCTIKGSMLRNGTTVNTFTVRKKLAAALFLRYQGVLPTGGGLDVGVGDYLKGTMSFLCKNEVSSTSETDSPSTVAAPVGTVIDSVKGIGSVFRGVSNDGGLTLNPVAPAVIAGIVQKIGIKWNQEGAATQFGIGSSAAAGVRKGKMLVTGSLSTYFNDFTLYTQYTAEKPGPISFHALDGLADALATKGFVITFCNATIMNPKIVAGGPGQDVMADFEIEGNPDVTTAATHGGKTIQIDYFG